MVAKRLRLLPFGKDGTRTTKWSDIKLQIFFELPLLICASLLKKEGSNFRGTNRLLVASAMLVKKKQKASKSFKPQFFTKTPKETPQLFLVKKKQRKFQLFMVTCSFLEKIPGNCEKCPPCIERCGANDLWRLPCGQPFELRLGIRRARSNNCEARKANVSTTTAVHNKRYVDSSNLLLVYLV